MNVLLCICFSLLSDRNKSSMTSSDVKFWVMYIQRGGNMQYVVTAKLICLYSICIPCVLYEAMFCRHICAVHLQQLDRVACLIIGFSQY